MIMFGDHRTRYEPENQLKSTQLQLSQAEPEARCPMPEPNAGQRQCDGQHVYVSGLSNWTRIAQ